MTAGIRTQGHRRQARTRQRPSQFTNVPAFSATAATGNTTSARSVTALARSSRLTTNGAMSSACSAAAGSGRSPGQRRPPQRTGLDRAALTSPPVHPGKARAVGDREPCHRRTGPGHLRQPVHPERYADWPGIYVAARPG